MKALILLAALSIASCAAAPPPDDRFLTKEEDQALREKCAEANCVIVPVPVWQEILKLLGRHAT